MMGKKLNVKRIPSIREIAWIVLKRFGRPDFKLNETLEDILSKWRLKKKDRALLWEITHGVVRYSLFLDHIILSLSEKRTLPKHNILNVLRIGLYQLIFLERVPPYAIVNESVKIARKYMGKKVSSFVNALLRKFLRNNKKEYVPKEIDKIKYLSLIYSYPEWLVKRWYNRYGFTETERILRLFNQEPPLHFRLRPGHDTDSMYSRLKQKGYIVEFIEKSIGMGIIEGKTTSLNSIPGYNEGLIAIQDIGAQLVGIYATPFKGTVLDACAGRGNKAIHLIDLMGGNGEIIAIDLYLRKIKSLLSETKRLSISRIYPLVADILKGIPLVQNRFSMVLVDAPCSGIGTIKRYPEIKWKHKEEDLRRFGALQLQILEAVKSHVKIGGKLIYATCSTEPEENEEIINMFMERNREFILQGPRSGDKYYHILSPYLTNEGFLRTFPLGAGIMDGFFAASLKRIS